MYTFYARAFRREMPRILITSAFPSHYHTTLPHDAKSIVAPPMMAVAQRRQSLFHSIATIYAIALIIAALMILFAD